MARALRWTLLVVGMGAGVYVGLQVSRWLLGDLEPTVIEARRILEGR